MNELVNEQLTNNNNLILINNKRIYGVLAFLYFHTPNLYYYYLSELA